MMSKEEVKPKELTQKDKVRIQKKCHERVKRICQRKNVRFDKEMYRRCVEDEIQLFFAGKKPRIRQKRVMTEKEIEELRERMARESDEESDEAFDLEIIRGLQRIHELQNPELKEARRLQRKKDKEFIESQFENDYYGEED